MEQYAKRMDGWRLRGHPESDGVLIQDRGRVE